MIVPKRPYDLCQVNSSAQYAALSSSVLPDPSRVCSPDSDQKDVVLTILYLVLLHAGTGKSRFSIFKFGASLTNRLLISTIIIALDFGSSAVVTV